MSISRRAMRGLSGATLVALLAAPTAAAHVSLDPATAPAGGFVTLTFRVPNESPTAGTTKVEVRFPQDSPVAQVLTKPVPGWTVEVATQALTTPVKTEDGEVSEAVRSIVWTAQQGIRIGPGEFAEFEVAAGPLPDSADQLVMPTAQTYDDGTVTSWTDPPPAAGGAEPEHPAPVLRLVKLPGEGRPGTGPPPPPQAGPSVSSPGAPGAGSGPGNGTGLATASSADNADDAARWLGGAGLLLGTLAVGLAGGTMLANRRRVPAGDGPGASGGSPAADATSTAGNGNGNGNGNGKDGDDGPARRDS
jgi:uncharacterized protein YcnI